MSAKLARKIGTKILRQETKRIAKEQIRQLFDAPLWLRIIFKR